MGTAVGDCGTNGWRDESLQGLARHRRVCFFDVNGRSGNKTLVEAPRWKSLLGDPGALSFCLLAGSNEVRGCNAGLDPFVVLAGKLGLSTTISLANVSLDLLLQDSSLWLLGMVGGVRPARLFLLDALFGFSWKHTTSASAHTSQNVSFSCVEVSKMGPRDQGLPERGCFTVSALTATPQTAKVELEIQPTRPFPSRRCCSKASAALCLVFVAKCRHRRRRFRGALPAKNWQCRHPRPQELPTTRTSSCLPCPGRLANGSVLD
jgi:hypothetical protein